MGLTFGAGGSGYESQGVRKMIMMAQGVQSGTSISGEWGYGLTWTMGGLCARLAEARRPDGHGNASAAGVPPCLPGWWLLGFAVPDVRSGDLLDAWVRELGT